MIENIIFDFGDVFINLDKEASMRMVLDRYPDFKMTDKIDALNMEYEQGQISTEAFVEAYKKFLPKESDEELKTIWNAIIQDFPEYRLEFIEKLSKEGKYKLFLLSNTNELHIEQVIKNISEERFERFKKCFDKFYLSHEIKLRKPNSSIFEFVLDDNNITARETIFIDDTLEHIQTAKNMGFHTWNLIPGKDDVIHLFNKNILL
ncbi:HAD family phosphatase [Galbibacter sp. EGI 63066]|uniref:HAD family hydrolase n=1 Tax=Galbibacter sp. EGI 63066 TaxID=2993559 RepID=UPI002248B704|nr:HAD family phosphatase [Galbibacter sp. EGI 63066]MCX2681352.1 HAD family phosphatase [Galbibacter sp. EGI 63066]